MSRSKGRAKWSRKRVKASIRKLEHGRARSRQKRDQVEEAPKRERTWERWDLWSWD